MKHSDLKVNPVTTLFGIVVGFIVAILWPKNWKNPNPR